MLLKYFNITIVFIFLLVFLIRQVSAEENPVVIAKFSEENLDNWERKSFKGETDYKIFTLDNQSVLKADSKGTASGLYKERKIDLSKTPFLNWSWRIENRLKPADEETKAGDDYAARIYVVISGGLAFWRTQAINYVWANTSPKGKTWPNAFAGKNAVMIALRSAEDPTGTWQKEKRNIADDLKQQFGENVRFIDAVAIMSDTDNTEDQMTAYFGDIFFTSE